jgi:predicted  nucleic acid-binding Zn-ribbon protein
MSRSSDLYDLQIIDSEIDNHRKRLKEIARLLADSEEIKIAEKLTLTKQNELDISKKNLSSAELKVKDQRIKIKRTDSNLYGGKISNPKELQDLQQESISLKRFLSTLEDRQLECMLDVDEKTEKYTKAQEQLEIIRVKYNQRHQNLNQEKMKLEARIKELLSKRETSTKTISPIDLKTYEKIRLNRLGVAVSKIENKACSACGATLTASLHQAARSPNQISICETCGRILIA